MMYQQPNHSYNSADSLRRLSSNNPFRSQLESTRVTSTSSSNSNGSVNMVKSPQSRNFETWVEKNKKLIEEDDSFDDDDNYNNFLLLDSFTDSTKTSNPDRNLYPPSRPTAHRTNSDSSIRMSSNNPFSSSLNNGYVHHREPPPVPKTAPKSSTPPSRPPKEFAPPPYEEAAGREAARRDYPREKSSSSSRSNAAPHRSHSDGSRPHRRHHSDRERSERSERHRDRESSGRHHSSSHHSRSKRSPSKKHVEPVKSKNLDTIDKLDVTGFFGGGFHHDGPFDACTPHRNKDGGKLAPVMAYAVDGPNSSIKGANYDPNQHINMAFGNYDENEIVGTKSKLSNGVGSKSSDALPFPKTNKQTGDSLLIPQQNPSVVNFDAHMKSEPVHGFQTAGLGSTTFIDGAPAPKNDESLNLNGGGLGRKKSLVQRLRKNSGSDYNSRNKSNDELNIAHSFDSNEGGNSLIRRVKSLKVGRRER